ANSSASRLTRSSARRVSSRRLAPTTVSSRHQVTARTGQLLPGLFIRRLAAVKRVQGQHEAVNLIALALNRHEPCHGELLDTGAADHQHSLPIVKQRGAWQAIRRANLDRGARAGV